MAQIIRQVRVHARPKPANTSLERISFFDAQATHRTRARLWSVVSAVLIMGPGSFYGFLMLVVISFYGLLTLGLFPKWVTAPLAAVGVMDNLPPGWFLWTAGILLAAESPCSFARCLAPHPSAPSRSAVGLRPVDPSTSEERQLANIVEEMAIAGGVPESRILLESESVNAGATYDSYAADPQ